jgi:hypothetical protein
MNKRIQDILDNGTPGQVLALFQFDREMPEQKILKKFRLWSRYFFPQYFPSKDAPHHAAGDLKRLRVYCGRDPMFLNIAYRGDAKTTRAKLFRAFVIANDTGHYRRYMRVLSKDIGNAKQSVTDIYNMLISKRVAALYPEIFERTSAKREETMGAFTTSTGIKMVADTIGTDQRGAVQMEARPDFDWYDDFETRMSLYSAVTTHKIWQNMEEAKTGLAKGGGSEYTCNYISERGNVHKLVERTEERYKMVVPIAHKVNGAWVPTWERYTREEVEYMEATEDEFAGERLSKPDASKDVYFAREAVEKQTAIEPFEVIGGMRFFKKFDPTNRTVSGVDVGGGVGLDSSTNVVIDLDCIPAQVIATKATNEIKPDAWAHVVAKDNKQFFGACYTAIEKNYGSTNDIFKGIYPSHMIHKTERGGDRVKFVNAIEYGFESNAATVPLIMGEFCKAVEDGLIALNDAGLIKEVRSYTTGDLMDSEPDPRMTTRHFDLLRAAAIAWHCGKFVKKPPSRVSAAPFRGVGNTAPKPNRAR